MTTSWLKQFFWFVFIAYSNFFEIRALLNNDIDINEFIQLEGIMIPKLQDYLIREQERLNELKTHLTDWQTWRNSNIAQESQYITIPQNLFHLFKISTLKWDELEAVIIKSSSKNVKGLDEIEPPTDDHLTTIIFLLIDLQREYDLTSKYIVNGTLMDLRSKSLSVDSCYLLAKTCFDNNDFVCAIDWSSTCFNMTFNRSYRTKIIKILYTSHIFLGQMEIAFKYASESLNYDYYDNSNWHTVFDLSYQFSQKHPDYKPPQDSFNDRFETNRICRGEHARPSMPNLKCRYKHDNSAFLKIAPLKEEELYDAPKILFYRDVLYDSEIEFIKNETAESMEVALLHGNDKPAFSYRITESTFLYSDVAFLDALEKRTEDMIESSPHYHEAWQIINYSPGGFYATHSDYLFPTLQDVISYGNRVTTILFYMNDVILGGETAFHRIGVSAKPTKGAALVWHNTHANYDRNLWTDHSACPVIIGEKWGLTKWLRWPKNRRCLQSIRENDLKMFQRMSQ